ncbi:MAG TPA: phospholipid carrier-dependent glycosyltransferase [Candidatus Binataceae bacterium]|nr:phospholipid carrier-dependent glycosyltransferase [Candidatus Binataceae bacterium]
MKSPPARIAPAAILAAIVIASAVLLLNRLGASDVCSGNEAVEGVFVQEMVERGNLLFPLENGRTPMYKPPLFHWTATALDRVAGIRKVTAANLRLASALYATAGIVLTIAFANSMLGADGAILAGLALAASYQYISQGRFGRVDMTLTFFETLAMFAFVWWIPPQASDAARTAAGGPARRGMLYLLAVALGLAVLAKGPVGAILPGAAIVVFMAIERRFSQLVAMLEPGPLIAGAAIASSWYLACYLGGRFAFLHRQLGSENLGRFFGALGTMTPWYYAKPILLNSAPLSLLVPIAAATALWPRGNRDDDAVATDSSALRARAAVRLFAIFWIITVIFFSVAAYKRRAYLVPLWPASAVMLAWWIGGFARLRLGNAMKWSFAAICCGLIVFNLIYIPRQEIRQCADSTYRPGAEEIRRVVGPAEPLYTYGFDEELAPLLFYLDRDAPAIGGKLGDAPPGYVIVPARVWRAHQAEALDLEPVLTTDRGGRPLVLLRRGKALAAGDAAAISIDP